MEPSHFLGAATTSDLLCEVQLASNINTIWHYKLIDGEHYSNSSFIILDLQVYVQ